MPRPKTITDEAILAVAARCFREHGHTVSTRDIARAAGISQAVLYQRFGGKEALFLRAMMPEPPDIEALLGSPEGQDARHYLQSVMHALTLHFHDQAPALIRLTTYPGFKLSQLSDAHEHLLADTLHKALTARLDTLRALGSVSAQPPAVLSQTLIALCHSVAIHAALIGSPPASDLIPAIDAMFEVLWQGVRP